MEHLASTSNVLYMYMFPKSSIGSWNAYLVYKVVMKFLNATRFWAMYLISDHDLPAAWNSASTDLRQVVRGRPLFRRPCGFHWRLTLAMSESSLRNMWPIHFHFRCLISVSTGNILQVVIKFWLLICNGQNTLSILLMHLLMNTCSLCVIDVMTFHVSHPYSRTDFTLVLNM